MVKSAEKLSLGFLYLSPFYLILLYLILLFYVFPFLLLLHGFQFEEDHPPLGRSILSDHQAVGNSTVLPGLW